VAEHERLGLVPTVLATKITQVTVNRGGKGNPGTFRGAHPRVSVGSSAVSHIGQGTDMLLKAGGILERKNFIAGVDVVRKPDVKCDISAYVADGILVGFEYVETVMVFEVPAGP